MSYRASSNREYRQKLEPLNAVDQDKCDRFFLSIQDISKPKVIASFDSFQVSDSELACFASNIEMNKSAFNGCMKILEGRNHFTRKCSSDRHSGFYSCDETMEILNGRHNYSDETSDIFSKDVIYFPFFLEVEQIWGMYVVSMLAKTIMFYGLYSSPVCDKPVFVSEILRWLEGQAQRHGNFSFDRREWKKSDYDVFAPKKNFSKGDCGGIFILMYVDFLSCGLPVLLYDDEISSTMRKKMLLDILQYNAGATEVLLAETLMSIHSSK